MTALPELVDDPGQGGPGFLDLVLNLLGGALRHCGLLRSSVIQNLVLAVPVCTLVSTLALYTLVAIPSASQ